MQRRELMCKNPPCRCLLSRQHDKEVLNEHSFRGIEAPRAARNQRALGCAGREKTGPVAAATSSPRAEGMALAGQTTTHRPAGRRGDRLIRAGQTCLLTNMLEPMVLSLRAPCA